MRKGKIPHLRGLHKVKARNGKTYFYSSRGGVRLPDPERDLVAFIDAFRAAQDHGSVDEPRKGPSTVGDLVELYRASGNFARLAASTQKLYSSVLSAVEERFGALPLIALNAPRMPARVRDWRDEIADRPRAADTRIEVLSSLLQFGVRYGHATTNAAKGIESLHDGRRADIIWSQDELKKLLAAATPECARAITVAAYTGLRLGDIVGLKWTEIDFEDGLIERRTNKSGGRTRATPPLLPEARAALESAPKRAETALTSGLGTPWTVSGLGNAFRDARNEIGVDKRFHDLRGTAATRFASAGFTSQQISAFMGWEESRVEGILRRYISRRKIAEDAAKRLKKAAENTDAEP